MLEYGIWRPPYYYSGFQIPISPHPQTLTTRSVGTKPLSSSTWNRGSPLVRFLPSFRHVAWYGSGKGLHMCPPFCGLQGLSGQIRTWGSPFKSIPNLKGLELILGVSHAVFCFHSLHYPPCLFTFTHQSGIPGLTSNCARQEQVTGC